MGAKEDERVQRLNVMLKELKKDRSVLTQAEFGAILGMQPAQISEILKGKRPLTDRTVGRILAKFPDINPDWLRKGEGDMKRISFTTGRVHVTGHHNEVNGIKKVNGGSAQFPEEMVDILKTALNEIAEQRKVTQRCQEHLSQSQESLIRSQDQLSQCLELLRNRK